MKNIFEILVLVGIIKAGESAITAWSKPALTKPTGSATLVEKINDGMTKTTSNTGIAIDATAGGTVSYALISQDPTTPDLDVDASSGHVTVTSGTISYSSEKSFTLVVTASDASDTTTSTATVILLVNAAPSFSTHNSRPCIADGATEGTELIDIRATDANSDSITYAIAPVNTDFSITTTGTVQVATGKTLNMAATSSYTLVITATDDSSTPLTATTTVTATVSTTCSTGGDSGAAALAVTFMTVLLALIVSLQ